MTGSQYKNVAQWTLANTPAIEAADSVAAARAIFNNLGVAFPNGSCEEILLILMSEDYMGWTPCTCRQAQEYANAGVAAVGVDTDHVVVILPDESADSVIASADAVSSASAKQTSDIAATERLGTQFFAYSSGTNTGSGSGGSTTTVTPTYPYVDIPQDGDIGTYIIYMGYHTITSPSSNQYRLKIHANNSGRYSIANPEYYSLIDGRIVIATKSNIGGQLPVAIGDYVNVRFQKSNGVISEYHCIIGDFKGDDAPNIWGHYDGRNVVEMIYHNYDPPIGYNSPKNDPWGSGRVTRITKVGNYGKYI